MIAKARRLLVLAVFGMAAGQPVAWAQGPYPALPPAPVPVAPGAGTAPQAPVLGPPVPVASPPPPPPSSGLSYVPPPPPPPPPPGPAPFPPADPGRNGWGPYGPPSEEETIFFNLDLVFLKPTLKNRLRTDVALPDGSIETIQVPSASLDWTVAPKFELGYRLPESLGLFALNYKFFAADGSTTVTDQQGNAFGVRTRADLNVVDLDYGTSPYSFAPRWDVSTRLGVRIADIYFDSRLSGDNLQQQESNLFVGAGPHVRLEVDRSLAIMPSLSLFGRIDGAVIIGQVKQDFHEQTVAADGTVTAVSEFLRKTQSVPVLTLEAGLSYAPPELKGLRFATGYQFEYYWYLGQVGAFPDGTQGLSRGELGSNGIFLRGEFDF